MIRYIKKIIKKRKLLKYHKRYIDLLTIRIYCSNITVKEIIFYSTQRFYETRCYNRLKKL